MKDDPEVAAFVAGITARIAMERFVELAEAFGAVDIDSAQLAIATIEGHLVDGLFALREEFRKAGADDDTIFMEAVLPIQAMMKRANQQAIKAARPN